MASVLPKGIIPFNGSGYCKPYTIRVVGDRIAIWLPDNCLVVNGAAVDVTGELETPSDMVQGWYMLPDGFPTEGQFSVYLRIEETDDGVSASFTKSSGNDASYIPIAQGIIGIGTDSGVTQLVKTAIVIGGGGDESGLEKKDFKIDGNKVADILASADIDVTTGGGGGGTQSVDVVTGMTYDEGSQRFTFTYRTIKGITLDGGEDSQLVFEAVANKSPS